MNRRKAKDRFLKIVEGSEEDGRYAGTNHGGKGIIEAIALATVLSVVAGQAGLAQELRFANHREAVVPPYALLRIGPFYSNVGFTQTFGYRWTRSSGAGTDFLFANRRGAIRKDGSEFPLTTTLRTRNYVIVSRHMDLDVSVAASYEHYPLGTQADAFRLDLADEGIWATLSTSFRPTPFVRGTAYNHFTHRTDYVDTRGIEDVYGGERLKYTRNRIGLDADWLMDRDRNLAASLAREDFWGHTAAGRDQERVTWSESLAYEQRLNPFWIAGLKARFRQTDYAARHRSDFSSEKYTVFSRARLFPQTSVSGWAGYGVTRVASREPDSSERGGGERGGGSWVGGATLQFEGEVWKGLTHEFEAARTLREGYRSAYETADRLGYKMNWEYETLRAGIELGYDRIEPSRSDVNGFSHLAGQLRVSYPLTRTVRLRAATGYSLRENRPAREGADADEAWRFDYRTWWGRIGTGVAVTRKTRFDAYYYRIERDSRSDALSYERDIVSARFVYRHEF